MQLKSKSREALETIGVTLAVTSPLLLTICVTAWSNAVNPLEPTVSIHETLKDDQQSDTLKPIHQKSESQQQDFVPQ